MTQQAFSQPDDQRQLDRLVDGDLSEPQRRELLAQLDRAPDGWRRLALSFLEAQCWQETASALCEPTTVAEPSSVAIERSLRSSAQPRSRVDALWKPWIAAPLAMAASFFVAFALGIVLRGAWQGRHADLTTPTAGNSDQTFANVLAEHQAQARAKAALDSELHDSDLAAADDPAAGDGFPLDDATEIWLPVDLVNADEGLDGNVSPAVPRPVLESLKRLGHQVQTHRSLWPVDLTNGQRALVPVDEVEIRYVGNEYY